MMFQAFIPGVENKAQAKRGRMLDELRPAAAGRNGGPAVCQATIDRSAGRPTPPDVGSTRTAEDQASGQAAPAAPPTPPPWRAGKYQQDHALMLNSVTPPPAPLCFQEIDAGMAQHRRGRVLRSRVAVNQLKSLR